MMTFRTFLELCRISNLPTVWSNVAAGVLIGGLLASPRDWQLFDASDYLDFLQSPQQLRELVGILAVFMVGISMIYCAGMLLNDYFDQDVDAVERPDRPIPSGRASPESVLGWAISLLVLGTLLAGGGWHLAFAALTGGDLTQTHWFAIAALLLLVACVIEYNAIHLGTVLSVVLMGLCRSLAFLVPALCLLVWNRLDHEHLILLGPAVTLFVYTLLISIVARSEVEPRWFGGPKTVMNMIAAMPLLDAVWLFIVGLWPASLFCVACAGMTKLAHRKIAGS
jgi:4-hydroxybenzoate polyprenyltransferase